MNTIRANSQNARSSGNFAADFLSVSGRRRPSFLAMSILPLSKGLGLLLGGKGFAHPVGYAKTGECGDVGELLPVEDVFLPWWRSRVPACPNLRNAEPRCRPADLLGASPRRRGSSDGCQPTDPLSHQHGTLRLGLANEELINEDRLIQVAADVAASGQRQEAADSFVA